MSESKRMRRRMTGVLKARMPEVGLDQVCEPRKARGKRWALGSILKACIAGMMVGCKSLLHVESFTEEMSLTMSKLLGVGRRLPDTTARTVLVRVRPSEVRARIRKQTRLAWRRKALLPEKLPFGVVAIDGKSTAIEAWDRKYSQRHKNADGLGCCGLLRTLTCSLVSSRAKICIEAVPIPPKTNEMGHFQSTFEGLVRAYPKRMFQVVSTDAGMCSLSNAQKVVDAGKDYLFCIKMDQPTLLEEAKRLLSTRGASLDAHLRGHDLVAQTIDIDGGYEVRRRLYMTGEMAGYMDWSHLKTVLRIESSQVEISSGVEVAHEDRYFISSLESDKLSPEQWLYMIRQHWAVENQCHNTWDTAFEEDDRPWIVSDPQGALIVLLIRRIAYNMLALFRCVTQRSHERRKMPWRDIMRSMYNAAICVTDADLVGIRTRRGVAAARG